MSLDWDVSKIPGYKELVYVDDGVTNEAQCVIWSMMGCSMSTLTEKNIDEFMWRLAIKFLMNQSMFNANINGRYVNVMPKEDRIRPFIGLKTNVSQESRTVWLKNQLRFVVLDANRISMARIVRAEEGDENNS